MSSSDPANVLSDSPDLTAQYPSTLSTQFSVPYYPGDQDIPQKSEDIESILKGIAHSTLSFEYIVVGGGTAGLVVASRLAESLKPGQYVCVVEAGKYRQDALIDVPGMFGKASRNPEYDWTYETVPQPNLKDRKVSSSAGRLLGGSSGINTFARMRASSPEYDAWNEFGNGWNWEGLLPYFKVQENYVTYTPYGTEQIFYGITEAEDLAAREIESQFRGYSGPVWSTHNTIYTDLLDPTIRTTFDKFGIKTNRTPGYGDSTGMFNIDSAVNRKEGTRSYAANTYLRDPKSTVPQSNVVLLKGVYATKILFDSNSPASGAKAVGLACLGGVDWKSTQPSPFPLQLGVKKEIIVSTGSYNTPRLLELSGIGNPEILSKFNISPVVKLPTVGENLQEHPSLISQFVVKDGVFTLDRLQNDPVYRAQQEQQYRDHRTGAYATTVSAYGFFKLKKVLTDDEVNELKTELDKEIRNTSNEFYKRQLISQRRFLDTEGVGDMELIMVPKAFIPGSQPGKSYVTMLVSQPHPVARGSVHISSSDPLAPPTINPNYLNNTYDTKIMTKAAMFARKLSKTAPLSDIIVAPSTPGPEVQTEAQFEEYVRQGTGSMQHPIGTASMAPQSLGGVVDQNLRIYGTQNVRVVDMSIAPLQIATHLLDTAYAIGEKGAALIKAGLNAQ